MSQVFRLKWYHLENWGFWIYEGTLHWEQSFLESAGGV